MTDFDLAVIGAGAAGFGRRRSRPNSAVKVALIERDRMGGDALNSGASPARPCWPPPTPHRAARRGPLGYVPEPVIDWDAVRAHVHGVIAAIAPNDSEARYRALGADGVRGEAGLPRPARCRSTATDSPPAGSSSPPAAGPPCRPSPASTHVRIYQRDAVRPRAARTTC